MRFSCSPVGFILEKKIGVNQPKRIENAKILIANTPMDTDKIKVFGSKISVESTAKVEHTYIVLLRSCDFSQNML